LPLHRNSNTRCSLASRLAGNKALDPTCRTLRTGQEATAVAAVAEAVSAEPLVAATKLLSRDLLARTVSNSDRNLSSNRLQTVLLRHSKVISPFYVWPCFQAFLGVAL
jgi:hypothetical protein